MAVRKPAPWMSFAADRILELLDEGGPKSPKAITDDDRIRFGRTHTNEVLRDLLTIDLVDTIGNGVYSITPKGRAYLAGQEDLRDVEKPE